MSVGGGGRATGTIVRVVDNAPERLRDKVEHRRDLGVHPFRDDFKVQRQVREEIVLRQSGHSQ